MNTVAVDKPRKSTTAIARPYGYFAKINHLY